MPHLKLTVLVLLVLGFILRLYLTSNGNFLFHMDNARDMVDIRQMVVVQKLRLIGPTSGIEGLFNGPAWYYLMAVPFLLGYGDPYALVLTQMIFWAVGGWFLLIMLRKWGLGEVIVGSVVWIASPILILSSQNSLSTNPVPFLMPVFFWLLINSLNNTANNTAKFNRWHFGLWMLIGLFWHLEMAFAFVLPIIVLVISQLNNKKYWTSKAFLSGAVIFIIWLLPQLIFDIRHQWMMSQSVLRYIAERPMTQSGYNPTIRFLQIINSFHNQLSAMLMNSSVLVWTSVVTITGALFVIIKKKQLFEDKLFISSLILFIGSILIYTFVPIAVMPWHILGQMISWLLLLLISLRIIRQNFKQGNVVYWVITAIVVFNSAISLQSWIDNKDNFKNDTASFYNQTAAIDEVYRQAKGQNFKAYVYMPSVIDYPYQYLFWWYGLKKYGYTPTDYAYLPNQPAYIADKILFNQPAKDIDSESIFLIKEPDHNYTRPGWEGSFINNPLISKKTVGPLEIETRSNKK